MTRVSAATLSATREDIVGNWKAALVVLALSASTFGAPTPAGASDRAGSPTVKVRPARGLVDGQTVTVTWHGWPLRGGRSDQALLAECFDGWQHYTAGLDAALGTCSQHKPQRVTMTRTKSGQLEVTVALKPDVAVGSRDCNEFPGGCWIVLANVDGHGRRAGLWTYATGARITFGAS